MVKHELQVSESKVRNKILCPGKNEVSRKFKLAQYVKELHLFVSCAKSRRTYVSSHFNIDLTSALRRPFIVCFADRASLYNLVNNPTKCIILFNIFIHFSTLQVSGVHVPIIRKKLLYLCDTGICHSVWVEFGLLFGF